MENGDPGIGYSHSQTLWRASQRVDMEGNKLAQNLKKKNPYKQTKKIKHELMHGGFYVGSGDASLLHSRHVTDIVSRVAQLGFVLINRDVRDGAVALQHYRLQVQQRIHFFFICGSSLKHFPFFKILNISHDYCYKCLLSR